MKMLVAATPIKPSSWYKCGTTENQLNPTRVKAAPKHDAQTLPTPIASFFNFMRLTDSVDADSAQIPQHEQVKNVAS